VVILVVIFILSRKMILFNNLFLAGIVLSIVQRAGLCKGHETAATDGRPTF
jgi:hypothetical protein